MTQTKTRASHFKGRVFKSAATSALALTALAGGITLSGGAAKANGDFACGPNDPLGTDTVTYTDLGGINFTDTVNVLKNSAKGGTLCNLELTGLKYPSPQKQFDIDYNGPLVAGDVTGGIDILEYTINKTGTVNGSPVNVRFDQVSLGFAKGGAPGNNAQVEKYVYGSLLDFTNNTNPLAYLKNTTGATIYQGLSGNYSHLWVRDIMTPGTGSIDNVINDFRDVPGPLPILGAGLAIGSVRKLRNLTSRLKVHSMA